MTLVENIMIANSFLPAIVNFFVDPDYLVYLLKKVIARWKKLRGTINQENFNKAYEYPELDLIDRYSSSYLILLLGFTFAPALPHCVLIGFVGLLLMYLCDKFVITRRTSILTDISGELSFSMSVQLDILIIVYAISDSLWDNFYIEGVKGYSKNPVLKLIMPLVLVFYVIFPTHWIIRQINNFTKVKKSNTSYIEMQTSFGEEKDYERDNPSSYLHQLEESTTPAQRERILDRLAKFSVSSSLGEALTEGKGSMKRKLSKKKSK